MLWRILIFLSEYAPLLLSGLASLIAYLLNLRLEDTSTVRGSRLRSFLKKWVEYRVSRERRSRFGKELILTLSLAAAFAFAPFIRFIFAYVGNSWNELVSHQPTKLIKFGAITCLLILSLILFWLRNNFRMGYAFLEIAVGIVMAWDALGFVDKSPAGMTEGLFGSDGLKLLAAIYVIIRGLINWSERHKTSADEDEGEMPDRPLAGLPAPLAQGQTV